MTDKIPNFQDFVMAAKPRPKILPLTHTTKGKIFQKIINQRMFKTRHCQDMNAERLFFFLGLPAYKFGDPLKSNQRLSSAPICMLIKRDAISPPVISYPFDSGCAKFLRAEYGDDVDIEIKDYELHGDDDGPERILSALYGDENNYVSGQPSKDASDRRHPLDFETLSLLEVIESVETNSIDDRVRTIEVQQTTDLAITNEAIVALVVPDVLAAEPKFQELCDELGADIVEYRWRRSPNPVRSSQIINEVLDYYRDKGISR